MFWERERSCVYKKTYCDRNKRQVDLKWGYKNNWPQTLCLIFFSHYLFKMYLFIIQCSWLYYSLLFLPPTPITLSTPLPPKPSLLSWFLFVFEIVIWFQHLSLPFTPSEPSHIPFPTLLWIHSPFFINCCMHICLHIHINLPKYNLLSPYNVFWRYIFRVEHLTLDNRPVCSFSGRTTSQATGFAQLPIVLRIGLRSLKIFPTHFGIFASVILVQLTLNYLI